MTPSHTTSASRPICEACGREIDPDCCGCGDPMEGHSVYSGHPPIPMGCDCYRDKLPTPAEGNGAREGRAFPEPTRIHRTG